MQNNFKGILDQRKKEIPWSYLLLHKETYNKSFDDLDKTSKKKVFENPESKASERLNNRVRDTNHKEIKIKKDKLEDSVPKITTLGYIKSILITFKNNIKQKTLMSLIIPLLVLTVTAFIVHFLVGFARR